MIWNILLVFFSLITLIIIHELGHFVAAKKFGVRVDEFGIGFPPRLFGKQFGETLYSLNLLPFGAFVKVYGEEGGVEEMYSFGKKPVWQRMVIVLAGVLAFWVIGFFLLSIVFGMGISESISDTAKGYLNPRVQILEVVQDSPASEAGLMPGDILSGFVVAGEYIPVDTTSVAIDFSKNNVGENITMRISRGGETLDKEILVRENPPEGQGAMGIAFTRMGDKSYGFFEAITKGAQATWQFTKLIVVSLFNLFANLFQGKGVPEGMQLTGLLGVGSIGVQASEIGATYFLQFLAIISIHLAVFNLLPIPALDGGKFMFLIIEAIKGSPVNQKTEQVITSFSFVILLALMIWITIKDIITIF